MKWHKFPRFFAALFFFCLFPLAQTHATKSIEIDYRHTGLYGALGPGINYDITGLKKPLYGLNFQLGYRFNEKASVYLQLEGLYTKAYSSHYFSIPAMLKVKHSLYKDLFIQAGAGYGLMYVTAGNHFARGTTAGKNIYNGFVAEGGFAYEWWFEDEYFLAPEAGVQFENISNENRAAPYFRINFGFAITWFDRV